MKRKLFLLSVLVLAFLAAGCTRVIDLTDEESKMIAEYAGGLLLKYDRNIDSKYEDGLSEADAASLTTTEEPTTEQPSTEQPVTATKTDAATEEEPSTDNVIVLPETSEEDVSGIVSDVDTSYNIAELLGEDNVNIKYSYYMVLDTYPSYDKDGVYIEIEAPNGYKLLVLKFEMENKTNASQYIDLYSKDVKYNIILNNSKSAKQMFTILLDDMYTYQDNLAESSREELVLIYQISEGMTDNIEDLKLKINYNGEEKVMQLQ